MLLNLLGNALKFTERGEVIVRVNLDPAASGTLQFSVEDTGIGIAPDQQKRVFQAFTQADSSTCRQFGGTGLGLAISSRIVELMGGSIFVDSILGRGSTFRFTVSLEPCPPGNEPPLLGRTIFVASPHAVTRLSLLELTRFWGMVPVENELAEFALVDVCGDVASPPAVSYRSVALVCPHTATAQSYADFDASTLKPIGPKEILRALTGQPETDRFSDTGIRPLSKPRRILVAEDNPVNQKITRALLEREGYTVDMVGDGSQAVAAAESSEYDLVLMDVQMPGIDGLEASRILRSHGKTVPIIALTACATHEDAERCRAAGMNGHVSKPIRREDLLRTLKELPETAAASAEAPVLP